MAQTRFDDYGLEGAYRTQTKVAPDSWNGYAPPQPEYHGAEPIARPVVDTGGGGIQPTNTAPPIVPQNTQADNLRLQQAGLIQQLMAQASGSLDTPAQNQLRDSYRNALQQQASLSTSTRGQSAGAQLRGAGQMQDNTNRGFAGDQQMLKLQEQQAAQALLRQLLGQQQNQDIDAAQMNANQSLFNTNMGDANSQFWAQLGMGADIRDLLNQAARNEIVVGASGPTAAEGAANQIRGQLENGLTTAINSQRSINANGGSTNAIDSAFESGGTSPRGSW